MSIHHQRGGYARAAALTPERRVEIARMGGRARAARAAGLVLHAQIVQRIQDGIRDAKRKGVAFSSLVFCPLHCETLFSVRASADDAWKIGVIALRAFRAAGLDVVIRMCTAGTYCEATIERAQPVAITEEVHDDKA